MQSTKRPTKTQAIRLRRSLHWKAVGAACAESVEELYGITQAELWSARKYEEVAFCRQCIYYTLHREFGLTSTLVGKLLGKNHGTIIYGAERIAGFLDVDPELRKDIKALVALIKAKVGKAANL